MMNRKIKTFLGAFIAISIIALVLLVMLHYRLKGKITVTYEEEAGDIEVRIENIRYSGTREGRLAWELKADSAVRGHTTDTTTLEAVNFVCYTADGHTITLTAPDGVFSESEGTVTASGGVDVTTQDGYRLAAQSLDFSVETSEIRSAGPVTISTGAMEVKGVGLVVEVDSGVLRLSRDVEAVIRDNEQ